MSVELLGVDFTCAPGRRKPITVARGRLAGAVLRLERLEAVESLGAFEALLGTAGPWFGAFDFPFGLPREFVDAQGLGRSTDEVIATLLRRCAGRMDFRALVDAWGNAQPARQRLLHRAADLALPGVRSTSPLQTRYVPVGLMYFEGLARLVRAGVTIPRLGLRLKLSHAQRDALAADASGDRLDAALCLMQAGWASTRPHGGMPEQVDAVEGWIATA